MTRNNRLAALPAEYPVELTPPDIAPYREGTDGMPYVHVFRADRPGPHVTISAVVHGNEPCGAIVLDRFLRDGVRPVRGTLSFAFVNVDAYATFDPHNPTASRWVDEDFNRLWSPQTLDGPRQSVELTRARVLRPYFDTVDILLDIHSMQQATEPLMLAGPAAKGLDLARAIGAQRTIVVDAGHAAGPRLRDYQPFINPQSGKCACLVECGQHWEAAAEHVALSTAVRFLHATGALDADAYAELVQRPEGPERVLEITDRVTVETEAFAFTATFRGMEVIAEAGTVIAHDGDRPVVTPHDDCVLIMPTRRLWPGQTAVRLGKFVGD